MKIRIIGILLTVLFLVPSHARPESEPIDGAALLREVDRNLEPPAYEMYRKLINIEPDGRRKEFVLFMVRKGNEKVAGVFISPASDKGRSLLRLGDNMWLYIPTVGKPIRITSLQSATGGVFNNADILRIDFGAEYDVEQVEDKGEEFILHTKAKTRTVAYDRLNIWVNKKTKLPVKIECLTEKLMLIKTLYFKETKDYGDGIVRPSIIETDSPLYKGYKSVMVYLKIKKRELKDEIFTVTFMPKVDTLRK